MWASSSSRTSFGGYRSQHNEHRDTSWLSPDFHHPHPRPLLHHHRRVLYGHRGLSARASRAPLVLRRAVGLAPELVDRDRARRTRARRGGRHGDPLEVAAPREAGERIVGVADVLSGLLREDDAGARATGEGSVSAMIRAVIGLLIGFGLIGGGALIVILGSIMVSEMVKALAK